MSERVIKSWDDVTLDEYKKLEYITNQEGDDIEKVADMCMVLWGDFPVYQMKEKTEQLNNLLNRNVPSNKKIPNKLKIGENEYDINTDIMAVTTAQFMDFREYCKLSEFDKMIAVFIVPKGHTYNDGYDMNEVIADMQTIPITLVNSLAFFLLKKYEKLLSHFRLFLIWEIVKIKKVSLKKKIQLIRSMEAAWKSMDSLIAYLQLLRSQN